MVVVVIVVRVMVLQNAVVSRQPSSSASAPEPVRTVPLAAGQRPRHPQYADLMARVRSFVGKVIPRGQDVQELASAGFYHIGKEKQLAMITVTS